MREEIRTEIARFLSLALLATVGVFAQAKILNAKERIGLNFIRRDANRPRTHDLVNSGPWLVEQFSNGVEHI